MFIKKKYGEYRIDECPFCDKIAVVKNKQGIPVCKIHKDFELKDLKCICGECLDVKSGKWGSYFYCMNCGNVNFKKGLDMNPQARIE